LSRVVLAVVAQARAKVVQVVAVRVGIVRLHHKLLQQALTQSQLAQVAQAAL
jgi:hypothetical protein